MKRSVLSLMIFLCACAVTHAYAADERPNIVLIMADDVGIEGFSCYGSESYKTPHIDALAKSGVRFTNCHSQPLCTPSRIKIMTGKSNGRNYVAFSIMAPRTTTFAHLLKKAGYRTGVVGKWQLYGAEQYGKQAKTGIHPTKAGFDEYCLWQVEKLGSRYWDPLIDRNGEFIKMTRGKYGPDLFTEYATDFFKRHRDKPFCLYYPMALVHSPFVPTPKSDVKTGKKKRRIGKKRRQRNFADMVSYMDEIVGRIVTSLKQLKLDRKTIVIFTADNGTHRSITSRLNGRTIRGGKGQTADVGTHVPLVVSWPGVAAKGRVCEDLIDFTDFLPTLLDVAGVKKPADFLTDGRSFLPQIRGEKGTPREWLYCFYHPRPERGQAKRFVRTVRYKLYGDGRFFDVVKDRGEQSPIPAKVAKTQAIREKLQAALDTAPNNPPLRKSGKQ